MNQNRQNPVGIMDSGIGGLKLTGAIVQSLPNENLIYIGDNARFPYGDKKPSVLVDHALELAGVLVSKGCKAIVVACGTLSSTSLEQISRAYHLPVFGVIDSLSREVNGSNHENVVVWATPATIGSYALQSKVKKKAKYESCPNLAVEVEFGSHVCPAPDNPREVIVCGCTHYSWLNLPNKKIDGGYELSKEVKLRLMDEGLLNKSNGGKRVFYFTGSTEKPQYIVDGIVPGAIVRHLNLKDYEGRKL